METWTPPGCFSKGLLFSALFLALELPQGSQAALHIEMIPEQPQKNQDLLLSLHGVPSTAQDFIWYLGEEASGGTRLFSYIPGLPRPQRDGSAMGQRDIVGFPNGSMLLRNAQPSDSGTYQVAATMNPAWTMKAKINVHVAGDSNIYEVMPSPVFLVSPISDMEQGSPPMIIRVSDKHLAPTEPSCQHLSPILVCLITCDSPTTTKARIPSKSSGEPSQPPPPPPASQEPEPEHQHYQKAPQ